MASLGLTVARIERQVIVTAPGTQGPPGVQGQVGETGPVGPVGPQGNSISIQGTLAAGAWSAPASPAIGDIWIAGGVITGSVTAVLGDGIQWDGTLWVNVGQVRGPIGLTGNSCIIRGTLSAGAWSAPGSPVAGDAWISGGVITGAVTAILGDGIVFNGTTWVNVGQLRGPVGPSGSVNGTVGKLPKFISGTAVGDSSFLSEDANGNTFTGDLNAVRGSLASLARNAGGSRGGLVFGSTAGSRAEATLTGQAIGTGDLSFLMMFRVPTSAVAGTQYVQCLREDGANWILVTLTSGGTLNLSASKAGSSVAAAMASSFQQTYAGQVVCICVTRSGTTLTGYVNGSQVYSATNSSCDISLTASAAYLVGGYPANAAYQSRIFWAPLYNRLLSAYEVADYSANGIAAADEWGSQADITSGSLVIGKRYRIKSFGAGDVFTNVGAASNATGVEFIATGGTPTTWTNSSVLTQIGCIVDPDLAAGQGGTLPGRSTNNLDFTLYGSWTHVIPKWSGEWWSRLPWYLFNSISALGANYERAFARWTSDVFQFGTEKGGSGTLRNFALMLGSTTVILMKAASLVPFSNSWRVNKSSATIAAGATYTPADTINDFHEVTISSGSGTTPIALTNLIAVSTDARTVRFCVINSTGSSVTVTTTGAVTNISQAVAAGGKIMFSVSIIGTTAFVSVVL